ncbi:topoisomerase [Pseudomonas fluorescens]|uniref:topoisomerase n=1 Tax=Pseudomonas fluorescens TaxID=294 RepID=UPI0038208D43
MAKRDPNKTARNRMIETIKIKLRELLPQVIAETDFTSEASLNATLGSKNDEFFDLKNDVIHSQEEFVTRWLEKLKEGALKNGVAAHFSIWEKLKKSTSFREYAILFLKRSYLKHFDELSKNRPAVEDAELWIGQENASYGLLVCPRFKDNAWENDKSEIRAFSKPYWTIGHVLYTGLVIPGQNKIFKFSDLEQYLLFFQDTLVRNSGSQYEYAIAGHYCDFVRNHPDPETVPLLIPEFRYAGLAKKHIYRLDFLIINPFTLDRVGFELSPWSTHGYLAKVKELTQKEINELAADNFAKEIKKHRAYFKEHGVTTLIFTDEDLKDTKKLFDEEIAPFLSPEKTQVQLSFQIMEEFFS